MGGARGSGRGQGAGEQQDRGPFKECARRAGDHVRGARSKRGDRDAGDAGQLTLTRRHERRLVLVMREHELDSGAAQRVDEDDHLATGMPEREPDPGGRYGPGDLVRDGFLTTSH